MKFHLQLTLFLSIFSITISCKNDTAEQKEKEISKQNETKQQIETLKDSFVNKKKITKRIHYSYITAESGLNYRDSPNGKVLGKFNWRDKVEYLFSTNHTQKIIDNYREIEGNWAAVKHKEDTVYVFDSYDYISYQEPGYSRLKLYYAQPYLKYTLKPSNKLDIRQAFVNVSESFYMAKNFIDKKDLRKDTITFSKKKQVEFLKRMNYSNRDSIFIYEIASGLVKKHAIKETPVVAFINGYSIDQEKDYYQQDYQIGFNLKKANYGGFAVIGKENPFIEKGLDELVFKEMTEKTIDENIKNKLIPEGWKKSYTSKTYYTYQYDDIRCFVKVDSKTNRYRNFWSDLIVVNANTKDTYSITQGGGESSSNAPLIIEGIKSEEGHKQQYIGKLFKNKPIVTFGYTYTTFGCPQIDVLDKEELPIMILCDNRH